MEYFCSYQERCYADVHQKLSHFEISKTEKDEVFIHLIENNFLNEERYALAFAQGKHNIKKWGKIKIKNQLKYKGISTKNIETALKSIDEELYNINFYSLAEKYWNNLLSKSIYNKNKFVNYLAAKGYETNKIYETLKEFENK